MVWCEQCLCHRELQSWHRNHLPMAGGCNSWVWWTFCTPFARFGMANDELSDSVFGSRWSLGSCTSGIWRCISSPCISEKQVYTKRVAFLAQRIGQSSGAIAASFAYQIGKLEPASVEFVWLGSSCAFTIGIQIVTPWNLSVHTWFSDVNAPFFLC